MDMKDFESKGKKVARLLSDLRKSVESLDMKTFESTCANLDDLTQAVSNGWPVLRSEKQTEISQRLKGISDSEYSKELEVTFEDAGCPLRGVFPSYELPPFTLEFSIELRTVKLQNGRRTEKSTSLAPSAVLNWVKPRYDKVVKRPFAAEYFLGDLTKAYEIANKLQFKSGEVKWGQSVPLEMIYSLLTLSRSSRQDYSKDQFIFDLARLRKSNSMTYQRKELEFGFSRDQKKSFLVVDADGKDHRLSSLTIYDSEATKNG